jgi:hypothetical protein
MRRTWLHTLVLVVAVTLTAPLVGATPSRAADPPRPAFAMPFGCGDVWKLVTRDNHNPEDKKIDFYNLSLHTRGAPVLASAAGVVTELTPSIGGVELAHGNRWYTLSLHMDPVVVSLGQRVGKGQVIGYVGVVGVGGTFPAPHLHYEQAVGSNDTGTVDFDSDANGHVSADRRHPVLQGVEYRMDTAVSPEVTSANGCPGGGSPGAMTELPMTLGVSQLQLFVRRYGDDALVQRWYQSTWTTRVMGSTTVADQPAVSAFNDGVSVVSRERDNRVSEWRYTLSSGWRKTYLQGALLSPPETVYYPEHRNLHAVGRGTDNRLYHWWTVGDGTWSSPQLVDGSAQLAGAPAVAVHNRSFHIVARTTDNKVWNWMWNGSGWTKQNLAGAALASPEALPFNQALWVFVRGTDDRLYRWYGGPGAPGGASAPLWQAPKLIDGAIALANSPTAVVYRGQVHVVARGADNGIYHWWGNGVSWQREKLPGAFTSAPSVSVYGNQFQIAGRGTDGNLYTVWYDGTWHTTAHGIPMAG